MNKFVSTALGLVAVGSIGAADPGDNDWLGLDSEINGLASSLAPAQGGTAWSGLIRTYYGNSSDDISTGGGEDLSGFGFNDIDLAFWGSTGDFSWRISGDLDGGDLDLEDAYVDWSCGPSVRTRLGMMKPNVLRSGIIDPENTLFMDRTVLGSAFDDWDTGAQASGEAGAFSWSFGLFNGRTGEEVDHFYAARFNIDVGGGAGPSEGARGGNDGFQGTIGIAITSNDGGNGADTDNLSQWFDFNGSVGPFGFGVDVGLLDDDDTYGTASDFGWISAGSLNLEGDSTPFSFTASYLINPEWEVGARYEDLDNSDTGDDNSLLTVGASYYRNGNNAKWQAQYTDVDSDGDDGSYFQVGLTAGASR